MALTDYTLIETWNLQGLACIVPPQRASGAESGAAWRRSERVSLADLDAAWAIGQDYLDQDFSIVDRTSFAVMERLGITRVASFDHHFAIYRYGPKRDRAFQIVR